MGYLFLSSSDCDKSRKILSFNSSILQYFAVVIVPITNGKFPDIFVANISDISYFKRFVSAKTPGFIIRLATDLEFTEASMMSNLSSNLATKERFFSFSAMKFVKFV